jgi:TorA maturation chaperone TorD
MTHATPAPISFASHDNAEELARAELYGLLARLWLAPPDADLLAQFAVAVTQAPTAGGFLEATWEPLVATMRATSVADAKLEFEALFGGVGKPEIFVYGSYHLAGFLNEKPLVVLRDDLRALGLGLGVNETQVATEDHIAYLCEVMRYLIAGDDIAVCNLEQQRRFFRAHLQTWVATLCDLVSAHPAARLYRALAGLTAAFMAVEAQAFDMIE